MPGNFTFYAHRVENGFAEFDENESRHALVSLRYQIGDRISFSDGMGSLYEGTISNANKTSFRAEITQREDVSEKPDMTMIFAIIKSTDRMEWMVEKCTELGVGRILFVKCANSERGNVNVEKLNKTAIAALKQSHGAWLPELGLISWKGLLDFQGDKWIAALTENSKPVSDLPKPQICIVGPEGDFTDQELNEALMAGYKPVSLGKTVLRTETAAVALAAFLALK